MACLDEETILAFCRGGLADPARTRAEEHLAECDECRALVSAVARSSLVAPGEADPAMAPTTPVGSASPRSGPPAAPVSPGDVLAGKLEVERVLGAGGMGVVVAARHLQLDRRVAVKFLLPAACEVPGAVARFLREGKAAAQITSEHVARVMDTGVLDGGAPYLVMEHLEGEDLGEVLRRRGALPASEAVEYVLQALEAIVEAHALGIVHRDLKPSNLFLSRRADGSPIVKVLDFGISKLEGGSRSQLTSANTLMGSPRYMSPEQMLSAKDVDGRSDVWALGVILFELVSGKPVWEADTVPGLCALIASAPASPLRSAAPSAPAALEEVIARCLAKSRDERIASVADLALALEPIAPPEARLSVDRILRVAGRARDRVALASGGPLAAAAEPARRGRLVLVGVAGAFLVLGLAAAAALRASRDASPPAALAPSPPSPVSAAPIAVVPDVPVSAAGVGPAPPAETAPTRAAAASPRRAKPAPPAVTAPLVSAAPAAPLPGVPSAAAAPKPTSSANRALTERK